MRTRVVIVAASGFLCGFAVTPAYERQARQDVATCVDYAKRQSAAFDATVQSIDRNTGEVSIERLNANARGEYAFDKCLTTLRKWRVVERNLPKTVDPTPPTVAPPDRYARNPWFIR